MTTALTAMPMKMTTLEARVRENFIRSNLSQGPRSVYLVPVHRPTAREVPVGVAVKGGAS